MPQGSIKTTTFRVKNPISKETQERVVAEAFKQAYQQETGIILEGNDPVRSDPPDRLFSWQGLVIGAELFEVEQLYASRALVELLTNEIYAEFERRGLGNRYLGVSAQLASKPNLGISTAEDVQHKWQQAGITRNQSKQFAMEFVDLFQKSVPVPESIPNHYPGVVIQIDPQRYPAMSALGDLLTASKSSISDIRRSDGRASPLVTLLGAITYTDEEIKESSAQKIIAKIKGRSQWQPVDRSILIAHDLPRGRYYQGFWNHWEVWLGQVANRINVLQAFDEFWLVTCRSDSSLEAQRICGISLKQKGL